MRCPKVSCVGITGVEKTMSEVELPKRWRGKVVTRRTRSCPMCGLRFTTVELEESEIDALQRVGRR